MTSRLVLDASALIAMARLGLLTAVANNLGELLIGREVLEETSQGTRPEAVAIANAIAEGTVRVVDRESTKKKDLRLGIGETATIEVAATLEAVAVIDDRDARRVARRLGVELTGTVAILVRMMRRGAITSVADQLDKLEIIGFRADRSVREWALEVSGEA